MGVMTQIPVKVREAEAEWIDAIRSADPHQPGRSTVVRYIVERFRSLVMRGIVAYAEEQGNRVFGEFGVRGTPDEVVPRVVTTPRPPLRAVSPQKAERRPQPVSRPCRAVSVATEAFASPTFPSEIRFPFGKGTTWRAA